MAIKQNNFRYLLASDLALTTKTQHVFGVFTLALVSDFSLARKEWLEALTLQVIKQRYRWDVSVSVAAGLMLFFAEYTRHIVGQFIAG